MGTAHPSASATWSSDATDAYFLAGGLVFGVLARRYRRSSTSKQVAHVSGGGPEPPPASR
jgi:hypothetical protein